MKKIDALVKKVEFFEKLAVYGDRESFLKAIAQDQENEQAKAIIKQMESLIKGAGVTDESILAPFGNATLFHNIDINAINSAVSKAMSSSQMTTIENADKVTQLIRLQQQLRIAYKAPGQTEAPSDAAGGTSPGEAKPAAKPALLQTSKQQIAYMNRLADMAKGQTGPAKANSLKQVNNLVRALQAALKNTGGWGPIKDYIVGRKLITDALQDLYNNKLEYDDLASVPALDFGRGVPEAAY